MRSESDERGQCASVQVLLDGQAVELPAGPALSLTAIRAQLELLALRQERVLTALEVDGVRIELPGISTRVHEMRQVAAQTVTFRELSRQLIGPALEQTERLRLAVEAGVLRVLISERHAIERLWQTWQSDLREPLLALTFLQELWGVKLHEFQFDSPSLAGHLEEMNRIACELDLLLLERPEAPHKSWTLALSDLLEQRLSPWLEGLHDYLKQLNERFCE